MCLRPCKAKPCGEPALLEPSSAASVSAASPASFAAVVAKPSSVASRGGLQQVSSTLAAAPSSDAHGVVAAHVAVALDPRGSGKQASASSFMVGVPLGLGTPLAQFSTKASLRGLPRDEVAARSSGPLMIAGWPPTTSLREPLDNESGERSASSQLPTGTSAQGLPSALQHGRSDTSWLSTVASARGLPSESQLSTGASAHGVPSESQGGRSPTSCLFMTPSTSAQEVPSGRLGGRPVSSAS
mmetsp:Transcript_24023/g.66805  ORF Transcript_24023/g.66805 Transcript_24023/m.66805 type:complete len:242 (+) Transcript_24023:780-1505(+)